QGVRQGEIYVAKTRFVPFNVKPTNFASLKKFGLRIGGIVLLRRAEVVEDGTLAVKTVETIVARESDSFPILLNDAAVCILPPREGTKMVDLARVVIGMARSKTKDPVNDFRQN